MLSTQGRGHRFIDLSGQLFGMLKVEGLVRFHEKNKQAVWACLCQCGNRAEVLGNSLRSGHTRSCGCLNEPATLAAKVTHGQSRNGRQTALYRAWAGMKNRCLNPNYHAYRHYGGRGISVCDEWLNSFDAFATEVGPHPGKGYSLDRINVDGNYEPGNVRWATAAEQANNRRNSKSREGA